VVARAAVDLYQATERWGRLVATYEILLGAESAPALSVGESLAILERARFICETNWKPSPWLSSGVPGPTAWPYRSRRTRRSGTHGRSSRRVGGAARPAAARLDREGAEGRVRRSRFRSAPVPVHCRRACGSSEDLKRFAERILALVPGDDEAENALLKLYTKSERWADLIALQHMRQARMQDPALRAELLLRIAHMQEDRLGDRSAAAATLREACEVEPLNMRLLRELARILEAVGDLRVWSRLSRVRLACASTLSGLRFSCAWRDCWRLLWPSRPLPPTRTCRLWRLTPSQPRRSRAWSGCSPQVGFGKKILPRWRDGCALLRTDRALRQMGGMLEALVSVTADGNERRGHLELLADLYQGPLADAAAAFSALLRVFEIDPANPSVRERLVLLAVEAGKLPALAEAARRVLASIEEPSLRQEILMHIAEVEERQPDRKSEAEAALRAVLELDRCTWVLIARWRGWCAMVSVGGPCAI